MERKYRMIRVRSGDYLLPSNDAKSLWRIYRYDEDGSFEGWHGTFWAAAKFERPFSHAAALNDHDILDWGLWLFWSGPFHTRQEAIDDALRAAERAPA